MNWTLVLRQRFSVERERSNLAAAGLSHAIAPARIRPRHLNAVRMLSGASGLAANTERSRASPCVHVSRLEATIFPIPLPVDGLLVIIPRPRGGDWLSDDVRRLSDHGIQVVVSLLCDSERGELGLDEEAAACARHHIEFISLPVPDLGVPMDTREFIQAMHRVATLIRERTRVAVHCRQSVGRSGLLAASVAMACGMPLRSALETISKARGVTVPETQAQRDWLQMIEPRLSNPDR